MLTALSVRNLRSFGDTEQRIDIRPLTIVMGRNSSGKSSLIKSMFLLRQTAEARDPSTAVVFDGDYAAFGSFREFAHRHDTDELVTVTWDFSTPPQRAFALPSYFSFALLAQELPRPSRPPPPVRLQSLHVTAGFAYNRRTSEVRADAIGIRSLLAASLPSSGEDTQVTFTSVSQRINHTWSRISFSSRPSGYAGEFRVRDTGKFYDLSQGSIHSRDRANPAFRFQRLVLPITAAIEFEASNLFLLGPLRPEAQRFYLLGGSRPSDVGLSGEKAVEVLWMQGRRTPKLIQFVRGWLERLELSLELKLRRIPETSFVAVELVDPHTKTSVQLADVGVGASQILPALIGGYLAPEGSTLVVEQPELHLHPAAQAEVADAFLELTQSGKAFIVETHSEHLVRRVQRRIAEGSVPPESVALYFVDEDELGSHVRRIHLDVSGSFLERELPRGFFDVDYREAEAISEAWRGRRNG